MIKKSLIAAFFLLFTIFSIDLNSQSFLLNKEGYFQNEGINIMVFDDFYPEGHQGGITIIQHDERVAANGDVRLEPTPGQWQPMPKLIKKEVDTVKSEITATLQFPDSSHNRQGFNPIEYPDVYVNYSVSVKPEGKSVRVKVTLNNKIPDFWNNKMGFNLEFFPGMIFGKKYYMDNISGIFPEQYNSYLKRESNGEIIEQPMAEGNKLIVVPESDNQRLEIVSVKGKLQLYDGRAKHNNGWFIVRSLFDNQNPVIEWVITPNSITGWKRQPVIQVSQVGYLPKQSKFGFIELDKNDNSLNDIIIYRIATTEKLEIAKVIKPSVWGKFLRYKYLKFDFTDIANSGIYQVKYGDSQSNTFEIKDDIYQRHVWQPVLEYFLPVQMCHMRINDRYRVWHGLCHIDDALMAPVNFNHFDGYSQGESTLCRYKPLQHVEGVDVGGWHDAGDYDLRVESQAGTTKTLSWIYEEFNIQNDNTTINQQKRLVEINLPDGIPDILQQIEHGALAVLSGYKAVGIHFRGIICPSIRQYAMLGDGAAMTDNVVYRGSNNIDSLPKVVKTGYLHDEIRLAEHKNNVVELNFDDRMIFTQKNPYRTLQAASGLAAASRVLKTYNPAFSEECLNAAINMWKNVENKPSGIRVEVAVELYLATKKQEYIDYLLSQQDFIISRIRETGWIIGKVIKEINKPKFTKEIEKAVNEFALKTKELIKETPYGVPYRPRIWGAGWDIQKFGVQQYYLNKAFPQYVTDEYFINALNFLLGVHPGANTSSFASGVGEKSLTVAYGVNRADWSYIPGGVCSGTALIRPDFPELKVWPYFWQQTEYVLGGGSDEYMFLVLAANQTLIKK